MLASSFSPAFSSAFSLAFANSIGDVDKINNANLNPIRENVVMSAEQGDVDILFEKVYRLTILNVKKQVKLEAFK